MNNNYKAVTSVILNGQQAEEMLGKLRDKSKQLREQWEKLRKEGDVAGMKKVEKQIKSVEKAEAKLKRETLSVEKVLKNLSGATLKELKIAQRKLNTEIEDMDRGSAKYVNAAKNAKLLNAEIAKAKIQTGAWRSPMQRLIGQAKGLLPAFGWTAIITAIGRVGNSLFKLTSQIQGETIRSTTVLGDQLGYVENQADKLSEKMGVTNREFVSMVANTGDLLIPLDFTREKAAQMATQVQSLAGALDEWTAGKYGVAEVSAILTKAMLGEMEQLKGLGIAIRQDSKEYTELVKQKELEEGATNAQARAMATLELLYRKSADAQAAYMKEGNKLLRLKKSLSLWFKQLKEDIATGFNESMKTATERYIEQQKVVDGLNKNLEPLLSQYDDLANKKVPLTTTEQKQLNDLIGDIATIMPAAVTEVDKYGKALGISTDAARLLIAEQKKYLLIKNADEIKEQEKALEKLNKKLDKQVTLKNHLLYSAKKEPEYAVFYEERIKNASNEIDKLVELKESRESYLKVLKGEPLIPDPDPDGSTEDKTVSLIKLQEDLLDNAKKMPETTEAEIVAKNNKIAAIEKEISRLRELGIQSKESLMLAEFLAASDDEQKLAIQKYFWGLGDGAFEAFLAAIDGNQKLIKGDFSVVPDFKEEETDDPTLDYAVQKYQQTLDFKFALNQSMYEKGLIGEQQYQDQLTELTLKAENERYEIKRDNVEKFKSIAGFATNFVSSLMDLELAKAGDNEEKKKKIKKKYADINFAVTTAEIVADTAGAIMEGYRQLGPIGGAIAAVILGATGLVQLAVANAERKKVKALEKGKYPIQTFNGTNYNADFVDSLTTGMYGADPHLALFNEVPGKPEMVIDGVTTNRMMVNYPEIAQAIYAIRDGRDPRLYANGKYDTPATPSRNPAPPYSDPELKALIAANIKSNQEATRAAKRLYEEGTYTRLYGKKGFYEQDESAKRQELGSGM